MTSQQLQCFLHVAERLNFTKAAEGLYLSVPTVTHHVKNLEEELGVQLFYRNSRIVKLTEQGEKFYYDAKEILTKMEDAKKQFQSKEHSEAVPFRIGCVSEKEFVKIEPILKHMKENYPYVRPRVTVKDFFDLKTLYENQQIELAIAPDDLSGQGTYKKLCRYSSYAVMKPDHLLAREDSLSFEQIADERLITLPPKCIPFIRGNKFQEFLALHSQDHIHVVSENEGESILLVKCGYGIALLPGFAIPEDEELACVPMENTENIEYGLYYRSSEKHIKYFVKEYAKNF